MLVEVTPHRTKLSSLNEAYKHMCCWSDAANMLALMYCMSCFSSGRAEVAAGRSRVPLCQAWFQQGGLQGQGLVAQAGFARPGFRLGKEGLQGQGLVWGTRVCKARVWSGELGFGRAGLGMGGGWVLEGSWWCISNGMEWKCALTPFSIG